MLDLKAQLLKAGLVTQEQVDNLHAPKKKAPKADTFESDQRRKALGDLKALSKTEQYDVIRRWVTRNRLDKVGGLPSEQAQKYFFQKPSGLVTWLTLEPDILEKIASGQAGIMAYMSHNGIAHSVMPKDIVEDVGEVFPDWVIKPSPPILHP